MPGFDFNLHVRLKKGSQGFAKAGFFDRTIIGKYLDNVTRIALARFGSFVRRTAQKSMKRTEGPSRPGQPPHAHHFTTGGSIKSDIYFFYDFKRRSVVTGALRYSNSNVGEFGLPALLEYGGRARYSKSVGRGRSSHYTMDERPYMQPAFDKEQQNLPAIWAYARAKARVPN